MTWHHKTTADSSKKKIWDHTQDPRSDDPLTTIPNDGGFVMPNDLLDVMYDAAVAEYQAVGGVNEYVLRTLADAAFEQIEEYNTE